MRIANRIEKLRDGLFSEADKQPWKTVRDAIGDLPDPEKKPINGIPNHVFNPGARSYAGHTGSELDWTAKTVKAGGHGVPGGENMIRYPDGTVRYFTVYEAKLIQTFPTDFAILGAWGEALRQIGNAVPVKLAETIGYSLYQKISLKNSKKRSVGNLAVPAIGQGGLVFSRSC